MKIDRVVIDCPRRPWIGQIDADTRSGKRQPLDTPDEPDEARVFNRIAKVGNASCERDARRPAIIHDSCKTNPRLSGLSAPRFPASCRPCVACTRACRAHADRAPHTGASKQMQDVPTTHRENRK
ncbi:hypothetical protein [Burkholderia multivorans]|uniref:hypothetical protein n=1 Tax=Burkholderia multivorans TaxID=87883 RepID=UPI0021C033A9|nr:hypothetical protein [Burkholderia multivorans]